MEKKKRDNRKTGGCRKTAALTCAAALYCALALGGCGSGEGKGPGKEGEEAQKDTSILVETASPQTESIELDGDFIGTVESDDEITVMAKIGGDVTGTGSTRAICYLRSTTGARRSRWRRRRRGWRARTRR